MNMREYEIENRFIKEQFRYTTDAQDNWMKPSGDQRPPQTPDSRSEEEKEKSRQYWASQPSYREIHLKRLGIKLEDNQCEYCLEIKKERHGCYQARKSLQNHKGFTN